MTDKNDPLESLWLQQSVNVPNKSLLQKRWKREKQKQFAYISLDFIGVLVGPLMLWLYNDRLNRFEFWGLAILSVVALVFSVYVFRLRRAALNFQSSSTEDFINLLKHQFKQNIKIARLTQYSVLPLNLFFLAIFAGRFIWGDYPEEKQTINLLVVLMIIFSSPVMWIWAARRARYFENELKLLTKH